MNEGTDPFYIFITLSRIRTIIAILRKIIANVCFPVVYTAKDAKPKTIIFSNILNGKFTGIVALGARNSPQKKATRRGVPIPSKNLVPSPLPT